MPAIDYSGPFHVRARSTAKGVTQAAIAFPVKASRTSTAVRFAEKMIPKLLPGWTRGTVRLFENDRCIHTWVVTRRK